MNDNQTLITVKKNRTNEYLLTCALSGCALPWNSMVPNASVGPEAVCLEGLQWSSFEACDEAWLLALWARNSPCVTLAGWDDSRPPQPHLEGWKVGVGITSTDGN